MGSILGFALIILVVAVFIFNTVGLIRDCRAKKKERVKKASEKSQSSESIKKEV